MKPLPVFAVATILALTVVLAVPFVANAHLGDPSLPWGRGAALVLTPQADGDPLLPWGRGWGREKFQPQSAPAGDYAIYVREGGAYPDDAVVWPVFEALESLYAAAGHEFTIEYWFKLSSGYDSNGKELFDHHIPSNEGFWTAFQNGQLWAGIDTEVGNDSSAIHIHTGSGFNDGEWHHYALVRDLSGSPAHLCLYLDGAGSCYVDGSDSQWAHVYEDIRPSNNRDGDDDNNYPLYVIGARTNGGGEIEALIDELRISGVARYRDDFTPPTAPFALDANTVMLFHFDEGAGNTTYGRDSNNDPIEGTLVEDLGWYGLGADPLDPGDPADAAHLAEMWVSGRFGSMAPSLTLTSPDGGEVWRTGSQRQIRWALTGTINHVSLSYSTDGFTAVSHTIVASTPNTGVYDWTTPVISSTTTRVRVADVANPAIYDDSNADFILTDIACYLPVILKSWP